MITDLIVPESKTKFLFFGGKGGVGKSTLSAATAVWLADRGHRTLLVSTDLQRSLSDIFEVDIGYRLAEIPGVPGLVVRETDPAKLVQAHWHRLAGTVQDVFGPSELLELMSREVSPCMMEMAGFYQLMELFNEGAELYDAIVFDTAPGGRALIEIRLPFTMIERYGEGDPFAPFRVDADPRLKDIIRQEARTRQTMSLMTDPKRTVFLYVLWPESLPVAEAQVRDAVQGASLFSPFPFHSVYSVEDHKKHVDWIKTINPRALISVKVSTPDDVDMVAVGSYYAGAHIIHLDGGYGGTGAAPEIAKKNIAMPIEYALCKTHRFLEKEGIRDEITLMASGGIRTAHDVLKAIALGADGVVIGTAELVAVECVRCGNCESGRGCPLGIATTDAELFPLIGAEWGAQRILNLYTAWMAEWRQVLARLGMPSIRELRGRTDVLEYV